ncbi:MAG: hypothetical protein ACKO8G_05600, partial [Actinomycetota bacterium]
CMTVFILLLLLLASIFGILGAVLKVTFVILMAFMLTAAILAGLIAWWVRRAFGGGSNRFSS